MDDGKKQVYLDSNGRVIVENWSGIRILIPFCLKHKETFE